MKFIIFGIGQFYRNKISELKKLCDSVEIICYFDNKVEKTELFGGKKISKPFLAPKDSFDRILLMSTKLKEMREQLVSIGYKDSDIWTWNDFVSEMSHGKFEFYCGKDRCKEFHSKILIITQHLGYHGGAVAISNAAKCLSQHNEVILAAYEGDKNFIREIQLEGINILIFKAFPYIGKEELYLFLDFDIAIVNVFPMLPVAIKLSRFLPVLWWIHEAKDIYLPIINMYEELDAKSYFPHINIKAVSNIAKNNFNFYFENTIRDTLTYGIPDYYGHEYIYNFKNNKIIFAIIGSINHRKAQDIFIGAIEILQAKGKVTNSEFWIIGMSTDNQFSNGIIESSKKNKRIVIKGQMTREQLKKAYQEIDVVVCPSREDPLPIVMTEGMMYRKVCIASDGTGTYDFIEDKVNGLVCENENPESLADAMEWVIDHPEKCNDIGINARKTYEEYFTMEKFSDRLNQAIEETISRRIE